MACKCKNVIPQSRECYDRMITVEIPPHMKSYQESRLETGLSTNVSIDPCIYNEICELWEAGITTYGSCCGHNITESFVNVAECNIDKMLKMGYIQNHWDNKRKDTFRLKSV